MHVRSPGEAMIAYGRHLHRLPLLELQPPSYAQICERRARRALTIGILFAAANIAVLGWLL